MIIEHLKLIELPRHEFMRVKQLQSRGDHRNANNLMRYYKARDEFLRPTILNNTN